MNSTLRQKLFRSTLAACLVLLPFCHPNETKAQQSASQTPASGMQNLHSSAEVGSAPEKESDAAAKDAAENPVAAAISLPLQNNTYYGVGPYRRAENVLLIEPVVPFRISKNWMVISRTIVPVVVVPRLSATDGVDYGLSNIQPQFYLSPVHAGKFIWGVGPQLWLPTATDHELGINKWGGGPTTVGLFRSGHWLGGALINNEFAGVNHVHENQMTLNPVRLLQPQAWVVCTLDSDRHCGLDGREKQTLDRSGRWRRRQTLQDRQSAAKCASGVLQRCSNNYRRLRTGKCRPNCNSSSFAIINRAIGLLSLDQLTVRKLLEMMLAQTFVCRSLSVSAL